ncbi:MAG: 2-dehydro-3-deoxy-D-arabinonate dehydratase, partial [Bacteroidota bacterium]
MDFFHLYRFGNKIFLQKNQSEDFVQFDGDWDVLINQPKLYEELEMLFDSQIKTQAIPQNFDPPIGEQEIWAAGVTYLRSKEARMEESKESGGATFYDLVYSAERPEVFYKGNKHRAVGQNGKVSIRKDSTWDVPEPELTLVINNRNELIGYTIGNDMSSRSIEGENPLYLPQAKVFNNCAGIGPGIMITKDPIPQDTIIKMWIKRNG